MQARKSLPLIAACAIATTAISTEAGAAAVLCQKKSGALLVREDSCKKKETPFDLSALVAGSNAVTSLASQVATLTTQAESALHDTVIVTEEDSTAANTTDAEHVVSCPPGYQATGGGVAGVFNQIGVDASGPTIGGEPTNTFPAGTSTIPADGWFARVFSFGADEEPFKVSVICVKPGP
jgi:hypothetical protein